MPARRVDRLLVTHRAAGLTTAFTPASRAPAVHPRREERRPMCCDRANGTLPGASANLGRAMPPVLFTVDAAASPVEREPSVSGHRSTASLQESTWLTWPMPPPTGGAVLTAGSHSNGPRAPCATRTQVRQLPRRRRQPCERPIPPGIAGACRCRHPGPAGCRQDLLNSYGAASRGLNRRTRRFFLALSIRAHLLVVRGQHVGMIWRASPTPRSGGSPRSRRQTPTRGRRRARGGASAIGHRDTAGVRVLDDRDAGTLMVGRRRAASPWGPRSCCSSWPAVQLARSTGTKAFVVGPSSSEGLVDLAVHGSTPVRVLAVARDSTRSKASATNTGYALEACPPPRDLHVVFRSGSPAT